MKVLLFVFFSGIYLYSFGQDTARVSHQGPVYTSDKIDCFVEGYKTDASILNLFGPDEITMEPTTSYGRMILKLKVKDSTHVVLKYFKNQAQIQLNGKIYPHNKIPGIEHTKISDLIYHDNSVVQSTDILEIVLFGEEFSPSKKMVYKSKSRRIEYYDVNGEIINRTEFQGQRRKGARIERVVSGQEAIDKYGDSKYADGVAIVTLPN